MVKQMIQTPIKIEQAISLVMVATIISGALGLVREMLTAAHFGINVETDTYFFAFAYAVRLPEFMMGAIAASMIPVYIHYKDKQDTTTFLSTTINAYGLFLIVIIIITLALGRFIVPLIASGFNKAGQQLVLQQLWILSPVVILAGIWSILRSILNADGRFFVSNISTSFLSVGIIAAIILLPAQLGIYRLSTGVLMAAAGQVIWSAYWLWHDGHTYSLRLNLTNPGFRRVLTLLGPSLLGAFIGYVIVVIDNSMATSLSAGAISALSYASRPHRLLISIGIFSLIPALLPSFSQKARQDNLEDFKASVIQTLGMLIFFTLPLSFMLVILRIPLIQLLFERGRFDLTATTITSHVFGGYVVGIMPMAIAVTVSTMFNALEDTKTPAIFGAGINLISKNFFNFLLIHSFGPVGLALATGLMYLVSGSVLVFILRQRLQGIGGNYLFKTFANVLVASIIAVSPVYFIINYLDPPLVSQLVLGGLVGGTLYLLLSSIFKIPEAELVFGYARKFKDYSILANF